LVKNLECLTVLKENLVWTRMSFVLMMNIMLMRTTTSHHSNYSYSGWLRSLVVRALDSQLDGCEFDSWPLCCRLTTLGKLFTPTCLCRSQWSRYHACLQCKRPWTVVFITTATTIYSLDHGLHTLTAVPRSTQPYTLCRTVK